MPTTSAGPEAAVSSDDWVEVHPDERAEFLRANLGVLADRGAISREYSSALARMGAGLIRSSKVLLNAGGEFRLHDETPRWNVDAARVIESAKRGLEPERGGMHAPVVLCGFAPPSCAARLHDLLRDLDPEYLFRRRLIVVHECERTLACALSAGDFGALLGSGAAEWFLGPGGLERLREWMDERFDDALPKRLVHPGEHDGSDPGAAVPLAQRVAGLLREREAEQSRVFTALAQANDAWASANTFDDSRVILRDGALGKRGLRVLVSTSRHSTYTVHAAEGLCAAMRSLGHTPELLIERDESSVLTRVSYARAVEALKPDLVVLINYTRSMVDGAIPAQVPFVTWIQDTMAQLLDPEVGRAQTGWDFTAGAVMPEMWQQCGYRPEMAMAYPVPACSTRFHDGPVSAEMSERFACEVAFVSNHSEPPGAMRDRLRERFPGAAQRVADRLWESAQEIIDRSMEVDPSGEAASAVRDAFLAEAGREPTPEEARMLRYQYMEPVMGRLFRHGAIEAAARICDRRGWRLHLYGNGWDRHPTLAGCARPRVLHGEELRACYASAHATLHVDLNTLTHQRVYECMLSGGLPVCRLWSGALAQSLLYADGEVMQRAIELHATGTLGWSCTSREGAYGVRLHEEVETLGLPGYKEIRKIPYSLITVAANRYYRDRFIVPFDPLAIFGTLRDVSFSSEAGLERVLERAVVDGEWRRERAAQMRDAVLAHGTTTQFAKMLLAHASRWIGWRDAARREPGTVDFVALFDEWEQLERDA